MSPVPARSALPRIAPHDAAALVAQTEAYLAAVDAFRAEGRTVEWRAERPARRKRRQPSLTEKGRAT